MDRSDPKYPNATSSPKPGGAASAPFAYQTRILQRTSSTRSGSASGRSNSISGMSLLTNPTGGTANLPTRRWTPSHRVTHSMETVRGQWEQRSRETNAPDDTDPQTTGPATENTGSSTASASSYRSPTPSYRPSTPPGQSITHTTPTYLKRRTMPSPIIASPLSPNSTGLTVELDDPTTMTSNRIHLPRPKQFDIPSEPSPPRRRATVDVPPISPTSPTSPYKPNVRTSDTVTHKWPPQRNTITATTPQPPSPSPVLARRTTATSFSSRGITGTYDSSTVRPSTSVLDRVNSISNSAPSPRPSSPRNSSTSNLPEIKVNTPLPPSPTKSTQVMSPPQYRSSYAAKKYGEGLGAGRKLGNHLPRIASGEAEDYADPKPPEISSRRERRERMHRNVEDLNPRLSPTKIETPSSMNADSSDAVAGMRGRVKLARNHRIPDAPVPIPSSRLIGGLWADKQRQYLRAYEYLCHVGEAQQWIEGCLGEELGFGVVELEDGLRNGVVLAKLVKTFPYISVNRIYEAPKLDFRHSDNINIFFKFVRHQSVSLPECFIFELTDLYDKKNLPKVIHCIHALSHLLARRGLAARIGNLLGRLEFSDDQLQRKDKDLNTAGVAMPNFVNVGRELAKEINEEPEVEEESEEERRDRLLLEHKQSITSLQAVARGYLAREEQNGLQNRMRLTDHHIPKFQARCRGLLTRRVMRAESQGRARLSPWATALQAAVQGALFRRLWQNRLLRIRRAEGSIVLVQAQMRGVIVRRHFNNIKKALRTSKRSMIGLQSLARARLARKAHSEITKSFGRPVVLTGIVGIQAHCRGLLVRRSLEWQARQLVRCSPAVGQLQGQIRGVLMRRRMRKQMAKLEDISQVVVRIQAAVRTFLARKRLLLLIRGLRRSTPVVVGFQARARALIARQKHQNLNKALTEIKTIKAVGGLQAFARAALARNNHREMTRDLEFSVPDVTGLQATIRGVIARTEYRAWRDHLRNSTDVATYLQALLRGAMQRQIFQKKMEYFRENLGKVVKIQSLFRARETREQYRQLTLGTNVSVGTIKNFVHLLDDSEADFQDEMKIERLRKQVVEGIRENQVLENDLSDLEVRIGLIVKNAQSIEDVLTTRRHDNATISNSRRRLLMEYGDPFSGANLDQTTRRKLETYQQLFYLLQTRGEYLSRLLQCLSKDSTPESDRRFMERVVVTLFGYGQDRREDYLLLKLFQASIREEVMSASSVDAIIRGHPMYINVALRYVRPKQAVYVRDALQDLIREIVEDDQLDLETNPAEVYRARIEAEELETGLPSRLPKDLTYREALEDPPTRVQYIQHLQMLQECTKKFVAAIRISTKKMPYNMRYLASQTLSFLRERFPDAAEETYAACIGRLVYYRYINPALVAPETFGIVTDTIPVQSRKNLAEISKVLTQVTSGQEFSEDNLPLVPINAFVNQLIIEFTTWLLEVADVPDAETQYHAHEFLDATVQAKPILISPNEIYSVHTLLSQHRDYLAPQSDDILRVILSELGGVPNLGNDELKDARETAINLELTNRFADVQDPHAEEKALWVNAKRGVLAILRVQPAQDLVAALLSKVTDRDEEIWDDILDAEMENERSRYKLNRRQPSQVAPEAAYRLDDIRSLNFRSVKSKAIEYVLELEKQGKITRQDGFQGILNAIASDVRSKHRKRLQRQQEMESMNEAMNQLSQRRKATQEQIDKYNDYAKTAMDTMQRKGSKPMRFALPFTLQHKHQRELQRAGNTPQFGSYLYTAKHLYEKEILLSIDRYSPRQFNKILLTMSSNAAGVFTLILEDATQGEAVRIATEDIKIEALLQAKFENRASLSMFQGKAKMHLENLLYQINKKFYVS